MGSVPEEWARRGMASWRKVTQNCGLESPVTSEYWVLHRNLLANNHP